MSIWCHVAGIIRVDSFPCGRDIESLLHESFGKTCSFEDDNKKWDDCTVPCGNEGSIQYDVISKDNGHSLSWGYVSIYGDLRGYETTEGIEKWINEFKAKINDKVLFSSQGIIDIMIGSGRNKHIAVVLGYETISVKFVEQ